MKNMKKLLSALTALSFVAVAGVSTVACGPNDTTTPKAEMNIEVLKALGLVDAENGTTLLEASIKDAKWDVALLADVNASKLLDADGVARNDESRNFLTSVLGLKPEEGKFDTEAAAKIKLTISEIKPILEKISTDKMKDFTIKSGTVTVQWKDAEDKNIGSVYTLDLKADAEKGVVADQLPKLTLTQFDTTKAPLNEFKVGGKTENLKSGELQSFLKADDSLVQGLNDLVKLVDQGDLKVTITKISTKADTFVEGDTLTVKINFGKLQFNTEYTFTVQSAE